MEGGEAYTNQEKILLKKDCEVLCNELLKMMEEDYQVIQKSLQGEIYDAYKELVLDEIWALKNVRQSILSGLDA